MLGGSRTKPPVAGIHRFSSTLQPDTNASHLRVGIVSKRRQAPVPFSLLVSLPSRLSAIFPSIPAIYSRESISRFSSYFSSIESRVEISPKNNTFIREIPEFSHRTISKSRVFSFFLSFFFSIPLQSSSQLSSVDFFG